MVLLPPHPLLHSHQAPRLPIKQRVLSTLGIKILSNKTCKMARQFFVIGVLVLAFAMVVAAQAAGGFVLVLQPMYHFNEVVCDSFGLLRYVHKFVLLSILRHCCHANARRAQGWTQAAAVMGKPMDVRRHQPCRGQRSRPEHHSLGHSWRDQGLEQRLVGQALSTTQ